MIKGQFFSERVEIRSLRGEHFIPFPSRPARRQAKSGLFARRRERFGPPGLHEQMSGACQHQFAQVSRTEAIEAGDALSYFEPIARRAADGCIHVRKDGTGVDAALVSKGDHGLRQFAGFGFGLHKRGATELHVENQGIEILRELLGEDGRNDERNAGHRAGHVAQGVEFFVRRHHAVGLAANHAAHFLHNFHDPLCW